MADFKENVIEWITGEEKARRASVLADGRARLGQIPNANAEDEEILDEEEL